MTRPRMVAHRLGAAVTALALVFALCARPRPARATIFDEIGEGLATVTGLRGVMRGLASGAGEGVREQLDRFVDETVDPLIARIDGVLAARIDHAKEAALETVRALEVAMRDVIDRAAHHADQLTKEFFRQLNATLDTTLGRLEALIDTTLCRLAPGGGLVVDLGPFKGGSSIKVKRPLRTHCYRHYLGAQGDPSSATFRQFEFFAGELCEQELIFGRIDPRRPGSMRDAIAGADRLAEMANSARCAAPTPTAKAEMVKKMLFYQARAGFLRRVAQGDPP